MRLFPAICIFALNATPVLSRDVASLQPLGLMHTPPASSTLAPIEPASIPRATTAALVEIERKADLARVKSDGFDHRIRKTSERVMSSICTGCLTAQAKAMHVRAKLSVDAVDIDRAIRSAAFRPAPATDRRHTTRAW